MAVYFIACGDYLKIGTSSNPKRRLADLQTSNPIPLEMVLVIDGGVVVEKAMHERFGHLRVNGEWFRFADDLRTFLANHKNEDDAGYIAGCTDGAAFAIGEYWHYRLGYQHPDMYRAIEGYINVVPFYAFFNAIDNAQQEKPDPGYAGDRRGQHMDTFNTFLNRALDRVEQRERRR